MNLYLISYDIELDKKRNKIADILKDYGDRVQYSVFECYVNDDKYKEMYERLKVVFGEDNETDSIRFYMICKECTKKIKIIGLNRSVKEQFEQKVIII